MSKFKLRRDRKSTLSAEQIAKNLAPESSRKKVGTGERTNTKPWLGKTATEMKTRAKEVAEDLFGMDEEPEDPFDDLFELSPPDEKQGRAGKRRMNVTVEYDPSKISGISQLLMESISSRGIVAEDYDGDRAIDVYKNLGKLEARTLARDEDRWHMFIFAAEYLRVHGSEEQQSQAMLYQGKVNPKWDETKENVEQDGRTIGGVDDDPLTPPIIPVTGEAGVSHTVRGQVESKQKTAIEKNRPSAVPADLDKIRAEAGDPQTQTWRLALEMAHKPREEWEGKIDWMLEQKVKYCYSWLTEAGELPRPFPPDSLNIFWNVRASADVGPQEVKDRRFAITGKIMNFWRKSVEQNGAGIDLKSDSYRTTLAALELHKALNTYVGAGSHFNMAGEVQDKVEEIAVQKAAKKYFQAHFPISMAGAGPGPLSTMDPDYVEYIRLCRQYRLPEGTLLHEAKL